MPIAEHPATLKYGTVQVRIYPSREALGAAAAADAAQIITNAVRERGRARIIVATGNSQLDLIHTLVEMPNVPWKSVEVFHLDEYVGMPNTHPSSFRLWIKRRIEDKVHPGTIQYMRGDAQDLDAEIERYTKLLNEAPLDLAFVGFGENG